MSKPAIVFGMVLAGLVTAASPAACESFGFVRVQFLSHNAAHQIKSQLYSNGTALGIPFSHNDTGFGCSATKASRALCILAKAP
jgi:hypothetical protein